MRELAPGLYEVASDSDAKRTYVVNLTGDVASCTCVHFAITRNKQASLGLPPKDCKHIRTAKQSGARAAAVAEATKIKDADMEKMKRELQALLED